MSEVAVVPEMDLILEKLSKIRIELAASFDLPFLKPIFDYATNVRGTMNAEALKRIDDVWAQMVEDGYAVQRKAMVAVGLLDPLPPRTQ